LSTHPSEEEHKTQPTIAITTVTNLIIEVAKALGAFLPLPLLVANTRPYSDIHGLNADVISPLH